MFRKKCIRYYFRKRSQDVLDATNKLLEKEEQLKKTKILVEQTLEQAKKLEQLKKEISRFDKDKKDTQQQLEDVKKKFENDFKMLLKKYESSKYTDLLNTLRTTTKELEKITGGEPVNIQKIEEEMEKYSACIDSFSEYLVRCSKNQNLLDIQEQMKIQQCDSL